MKNKSRICVLSEIVKKESHVFMKKIKIRTHIIGPIDQCSNRIQLVQFRGKTLKNQSQSSVRILPIDRGHKFSLISVYLDV